MSPGTAVTASAPGRVNLIGDHIDYVGGLVLPIAIDRGTTVSGIRGGKRVVLRSEGRPGTADMPLDVTDLCVQPRWARFVAAVVAEVRPPTGFRGSVSSNLPIGGGLSSSAALTVSVALALGADPEPVALARLCQRAEVAATGVPCGIMDQLVATSAVAGRALLIDCSTTTTRTVPLPAGVDIVAVDSGETRVLGDTPYTQRRAEAEERDAGSDPVLARRARHVVTENDRVRAFVAAAEAGDAERCGRLMVASHASLRDDMEVSTPALDAVVDRLVATPGVYGARLTGAGFGGWVVALAEPGVVTDGWPVLPSGAARRSE